jgi:hypothetical protein
MPFALRNTYAHFKRNPWCGGLTGELRVERPYRNLLTSVQYMEWKVSRLPAVQCLGIDYCCCCCDISSADVGRCGQCGKPQLTVLVRCCCCCHAGVAFAEQAY